MSEPIVVAELPKNARERLRVALTEYNGHRLCDVRTFYQDRTGEWRPGKGISVRRALLPELRKALLAAERADRDQDRPSEPQ